jgi:hypothetical protein
LCPVERATDAEVRFGARGERPITLQQDLHVCRRRRRLDRVRAQQLACIRDMRPRLGSRVVVLRFGGRLHRAVCGAARDDVR